MGKQAGYTLVEIVIAVMYLVVLPLAVFGYGWNVYKLVHTDFAAITVLSIVRIVGLVVPPLGSIVGYF